MKVVVDTDNVYEQIGARQEADTALLSCLVLQSSKDVAFSGSIYRARFVVCPAHFHERDLCACPSELSGASTGASLESRLGTLAGVCFSGQSRGLRRGLAWGRENSVPEATRGAKDALAPKWHQKDPGATQIERNLSSIPWKAHELVAPFA